MFTNVNTPDDRLKVWRDLRHTNFSSAEELIKQFQNIKILPRYLDYYTPSSWPNPFEIVSEGYFCKSGVTIILTATLINKGFITDEELEFLVISNNIDGTDGLVLAHKDKVYNFFADEVVTKQFALDNSVVFAKHKVSKKDLFA